MNDDLPMSKEEYAERIKNLPKIDVTSAEKVADSGYKASETKPVLRTVETKPDPELAPSIGILEAFSSNLQLWWQQNVGKYFKGEEIESPTPSIPSLNWKWLAIGAAVIGVLIVLLKWIV